MSTAHPRRSPPLAPDGEQETDPHRLSPTPGDLDPLIVHERETGWSVVVSADRDEARLVPKQETGGSEVSEKRDKATVERLSPDQVTRDGDGASLEWRNNLLKLFISQYLAFPVKDCQAVLSVDQKYPFAGAGRGFLRYYANASFTDESTSDSEPTLSQKFAAWLKQNVDNVEDKLQDLMMEHVYDQIMHGFFPSGAMAGPTLRSFLRSMESIKRQLPKVQKSASTIEIKVDEGVKVLGEIRDTASRMEKLLNETVKSVKDAEKKGASEEGEKIILQFVEKMKQIENHDLSIAMKQIDRLSQLAEIPFTVKKRLVEMKAQIDLLRKLMLGAVMALGFNPANLSPEVKANPEAAVPACSEATSSETLKPAPEATVPVMPFNKLGKDARDILHKNFLGNVPYLGEMQCSFRKTQLNSSLAVKASSAPDVCAILKHEEVWGGSKVIGDVRVVLPFKNRLDASGAIVPVKKTCVAKLLFLHERACLSATVGLHSDPLVSLAAMVGTGSPSFGRTSVSGGGMLSFRSIDGSVTGFETGLSITNPDWGTASAIATLLENNRGIKAMYSHKVHEKTTIAAELSYNHQTKAVVGCAGVAHRYDKAVLIKGKLSSNGTAEAFVETEESIAGSKVGASVTFDLRRLDQAPRVGFSISINPTRG